MTTQANNAPTAVVLPSLNIALKPFHNSPYAIQTVFEAFSFLVDVAFAQSRTGLPPLNLTDEPVERMENLKEFGPLKWQHFLSSLETEENPFFRDPESIQAVQVIRRIDYRTAIREIQSELGALGGPSWATSSIPRDGYSKIWRALAWVATSAMHPSLSIPEHTREYFQALMTPQPSYFGGIGRGNTPPPELFGPNGSIKLILDAFQTGFQQQSVDTEAIHCILSIVLREAIHVAHTWNHVRRELQQGTIPSYRWYLAGLEHAYDEHIHMIQNLYSEVPYRVRDRLRNTSFIDIWDRLWQEAINISAVTDITKGQLPFEMYEWVVESAMKFHTGPIELIHGMDLQKHLCDLIRSEGEEFQYMDEPQYLVDGVGRYFYGHVLADPPPRSDPRPDPGPGLEPESALELPENFFEPARIVAYGRLIPTSCFTMYVPSPPDDASCSICLNKFLREQATGMKCCRLKKCKDLFHRKCIHGWMNGTNFNSNLCPNCRTEIFPFRLRRKVRVEGGGDMDVGVMDVGDMDVGE